MKTAQKPHTLPTHPEGCFCRSCGGPPLEDAESTLDRLEDGGPTRQELGQALIMLCAAIVEYQVSSRDHMQTVSARLEMLKVSDFRLACAVGYRASVKHPDWAPGYAVHESLVPGLRMTKSDRNNP